MFASITIVFLQKIKIDYKKCVQTVRFARFLLELSLPSYQKNGIISKSQGIFCRSLHIPTPPDTTATIPRVDTMSLVLDGVAKLDGAINGQIFINIIVLLICLMAIHTLLTSFAGLIKNFIVAKALWRGVLRYLVCDFSA